MSRASITDLRARLSRYLAEVKAGEEVIVTKRGIPIARLAPLAMPERMESRVNWLIRTGLARPPLKKPSKGFWKRFLKLPRPKDPEGRSLRALLEERAEGR